MLLTTIDSMKRRMTWTDARTMLRMSGIEPGLGWDATKEKLEKLPSLPDFGPLQDRLIEHILCGEKYTKLYMFDGSLRNALQAKILNVDIGTEIEAARYPASLNSQEMIGHGDGFTPISIERSEDGVGLVLSTVFRMKLREEIGFDKFEEPASIRKRYDEVIGLTYMEVQIACVIWVPHLRDHLEVRVDCPKGMGQDAIHAFHSQLRKKILSWGVLPEMAAVNLFPAVRAFYDDKGQGRVTEMMFSTTTGGIKNEKILTRGGGTYLDQRDEAYHVGGKGSLDHDINVYRVALEWRIEEDNLTFRPTLSLVASGPSGQGAGGTPTISGAYIGRCIRSADYEFVIDRLGQKVQLEE
jgi:hypothetical protein